MESGRKVYRLALYGRRASGKTSILAALALASRERNASGLTCDWLGIPPGLARPPGDPAGWPADDPAAAFALGKEWLDQAVRCLERRQSPPPNNNDASAFRFRFEFKAADSGHNFLVELIDYSGELIEPELSDSELARKLRDRLLEMDGILILAEAPRRGERLTGLYAELDRLTRAFALLRAESKGGPQLNVPVALLVNKWDRQTRLEAHAAGAARKEVDAFLAGEPQPPHCKLIDNVRASVKRGNFELFAVSAYGRHAREDAPGADGEGLDRPADLEILPSFGLEDGFVWACQRRDEIDLEGLERQAAALAWWRPWQVLGLGLRLRDQRDGLDRRLPDGTAEKARLARVAHRSFRAAAGQIIFLAALTAGTALAVEAHLDDGGDRASAIGPQGLPEGGPGTEPLDRRDRWLEDYYQAPFFRHWVYGSLFLSRREARGELEKVRGELADRYWALVNKKTNDLPTTVREAQAMRRRLPQCRQLPELDQIIARGEEELRKARHLLEAEYADALRLEDFRRAARLLAEQSPESPGVAELKADFAAKAPNLLAEKKARLVKDGQWARAREDLNADRRDTHVKRLLTEYDLRKIDDLAHDVDVQEDRSLYALLEGRNTRTPDNVRRYLAEAPLKAMWKHVEDVQTYMKKMGEPLEMEIEGTVIWGDCWANYRNSVRVTLGDREFIDAEATSTTGGSSELGAAKLTSKMNDKVSLNVHIRVTSSYFVFYSREHGRGTFEGTVSDLRGGKMVDLDKFGNKVFLKVREGSLPAEPRLPAWRE